MHRAIKNIFTAARQQEGAGFWVNRPFPTANLDMLDPFLLLDEMGPETFAAGEAKGAPDHPHRGFETVTYILEGEFEHKDSTGGHGVITAGDVQWMTAGDGVVHSEMPSDAMQQKGGKLHGFQLWVNLPQAKKRVPPRYQPLDQKNIALIERDGWQVRLLAGSLLGVDGPAATHTSIIYAHVTVQPGAIASFEAPATYNCGLYVFAGSANVGESNALLEKQQFVSYERAAGAIEIEAKSDEPFEALFMGGEPLNEPVARYGPFVMNTRAELQEAVEDFNAGRMGKIAPEGL